MILQLGKVSLIDAGVGAIATDLILFKFLAKRRV
jgi:hypothetical protein